MTVDLLVQIPSVARYSNLFSALYEGMMNGRCKWFMAYSHELSVESLCKKGVYLIPSR